MNRIPANIEWKHNHGHGKLTFSDAKKGKSYTLTIDHVTKEQLSRVQEKHWAKIAALIEKI